MKIIMSTLFILLILQTTLLFFSVESICLNNGGNYTLNSTYANNLDTVLSLIPANIDINGFYNASAGSQTPDIAYATALCGGDVQPDVCRRCIQDLTIQLRTDCPNQRQAVQWVGSDTCVLRYALFGIMETTSRNTLPNDQNATNPDEFMRELRGILDNLRERAANGGPLRKVAAEVVRGRMSSLKTSMRWCSAPRIYPPMTAEAAYLLLLLRYRDAVTGGEGVGPVIPAAIFVTRRTSSGNDTTRTIVIVVVSIVAFLILAVFVFILFRKRIKQRPTESHENGDEIITDESLKYTLSAIKTATCDFSDDNKLGQGGFGVVYKGKLLNDQEIAVKRLSKDSGQGDQEFKNEVLLLAKLQHRNLVRLLGFCLEGIEKLLIYEFVQNASLDQFIFDPIKRSVLDWEKRYKIIVGIARGILYLHEDSRVRIIHRDLKPSNVLLDGAMNPKIADFGMARLFGQDDTQGNTSKIAGTFGYMAPEYAMHGQFSIKSDVFSFGVLVLEIISGQKNKNVRRGEIVEDLLSFAWKNWKERTPVEIVDPCLRSCSGSMSDIMRCIHIGLLCVQENAEDRPTMALVVLMLNSVSITLAIPTEPAFFMPSDYGSDSAALLHENNSRWSDNKNSSNSNVQTQSDPSSRNEASISELYPR